MKGNYQKRVATLEALLLGPKPAAKVDPVTSQYLDGVFTGVIQDGDGLRVYITRPLSFDRDTDGTWLVYSGDHDASVSVVDPLACEALDAIVRYIADPTTAACVTVAEPDGETA